MVAVVEKVLEDPSVAAALAAPLCAAVCVSLLPPGPMAQPSPAAAGRPAGGSQEAVDSNAVNIFTSRLQDALFSVASVCNCVRCCCWTFRGWGHSRLV